MAIFERRLLARSGKNHCHERHLTVCGIRREVHCFRSLVQRVAHNDVSVRINLSFRLILAIVFTVVGQGNVSHHLESRGEEPVALSHEIVAHGPLAAIFIGISFLVEHTAHFHLVVLRLERHVLKISQHHRDDRRADAAHHPVARLQILAQSVLCRRRAARHLAVADGW